MQPAWRYLSRMVPGFYLASDSHRQIGMEFFPGSAPDVKAEVGQRLAAIVATLGPSEFHLGVAEFDERREPKPLVLPPDEVPASRLEAYYFIESADREHKEIEESHFSLPLPAAATVLGDLFERVFTHGGAALRFELS
jgi:hypothetical protein